MDFLRSHRVTNDLYTPPVFLGVIGIDQTILRQSTLIAESFQRACLAAWKYAKEDQQFATQLFRPFEAYPLVRDTAEKLPLHMEFFRIDFYLDPVTQTLKIIEVNASPGALPEHECMDQFWGSVVSNPSLPNTEKLKPRDVLLSFIRYVEKATGKKPRTMGLIARDNGRDFCLAEAELYAKALKGTGVDPVLCCIDRTNLEIHPRDRSGRSSVNDIDVLYHNPSGTLVERQNFSMWLKKRKIFLMPPRTNLLFTNKSFLTLLFKCLDILPGLEKSDREILQRALLPSFGLRDLSNHAEDMRSWKGIALKRDVGSSGSFVEIFSFEKISSEKVCAHLQSLCERYRTTDETWTVQALARYPTVELHGTHYGFDIMVYSLFCEGMSKFLFSSRPFTGEKANISQGAFYGQIYPLPFIPVP